MATIADLLKAAEAANARAAHYAADAKRLYDTLVASGGTLTPEDVQRYYDAIESNRDSARAAQDHLGDILRELARKVASQRP